MASHILGSNAGSIAEARKLAQKEPEDPPSRVPQFEYTRPLRYQYRAKVREFARRYIMPDFPLCEYLDSPDGRLEPEGNSKKLKDGRKRKDLRIPCEVVVLDFLKSREHRVKRLNCLAKDIDTYAKRNTKRRSEPADPDQDIIHELTTPAEEVATRLIVMPDPSPSLISLLGVAFNIHPSLFVNALGLLEKEDTKTFRMPNQNFYSDAKSFSYQCESQAELATKMEFDPITPVWTMDAVARVMTGSMDTLFEQRNRDEVYSGRIIDLERNILFCPPPPRADHKALSLDIQRKYKILDSFTCQWMTKQSKPIFLVTGTPASGESLYSTPLKDMFRLPFTTATSDPFVFFEDTGNPFFSAKYSNKTFDFDMGKSQYTYEPNNVPSSLHHYIHSLLDEPSFYQDIGHLSFLKLNLHASSRAAEAFKETCRRTGGRFEKISRNIKLRRLGPDVDYVGLLRKNREELIQSGLQVEANISQFDRITTETFTLLDEEYAQLGREMKDHREDLIRIQKSYHALIQQNERIIQDFHLDLQVELTQTQISESRVSIAQNLTVKRLTVLAFVFIPVSTVATIFGANVEGISNVPIRTFVASVLSVSLGVLFIAGYSHILAIFRTVEAILIRPADNVSWGEIIDNARLRRIYTSRRSFRLWFSEVTQLTLAWTYIIVIAILDLIVSPAVLFIVTVRRIVSIRLRSNSKQVSRRINLFEENQRDRISKTVSKWMHQVRPRDPRYRWLRIELLILPLVFVYAWMYHYLYPESD